MHGMLKDATDKTFINQKTTSHEKECKQEN